MISTSDFHTGLTIELDGDLYTVVEFQHVKPGKGAAFVRSKLKNLRTGATTERTFRAGEKVSRAIMERKTMEYLYSSEGEYYLMDMENYEQISLSREQMEEAIKYLTENEKLTVIMHGEKVVGVDLPNTVTLKVAETDPAFKGDTAAGGTKPAKLVTGLVVQVPFFIEAGDLLKVDTRSGAYLERV